jgi:enoyl reductase-like protein
VESLVDIVLSGENLRTIILMVVIIGGFLLQNARMDKRFVEVRSELKGDIAGVRSELKGDIAALRSELKADIAEVDKRFVEVDKRFVEMKGEMAGVEARLNGRIEALKDNDFAHLNNAFKNLTYVMEKKQLIDADDKAFIDKALDDG